MNRLLGLRAVTAGICLAWQADKATAFQASCGATCGATLLGPNWKVASQSLIPLSMATTDDNEEFIDEQPVPVIEEADERFGFWQRLESLKCLVLGAVVGSLVCAPFSAVHDLILLDTLEPTVLTNNLAQWEFDTDMAALQAGLFAIVYRYCVRTDENPQLGEGVVGAFVLTRTLSHVVIPPYCSAMALNCGDPLGYLDWSILGQIAVSGVESAAMFGATANALKASMDRGFIQKFPS